MFRCWQAILIIGVTIILVISAAGLWEKLESNALVKFFTG